MAEPKSATKVTAPRKTSMGKKQDVPIKLTPESKREEFRRYLEKAGVMDALTRVLVGLYEEPEKPANAIEYFLERLSKGAPLKNELASISAEMTELKHKLTELEEENERLRRRLEMLENSNEGNEAEAGNEIENV